MILRVMEMNKTYLLEPEKDIAVYRSPLLGGNGDYENTISLYFHPEKRSQQELDNSIHDEKGFFYYVSAYNGVKAMIISGTEVFWFLNYLRSKHIPFNESFSNLLL